MAALRARFTLRQMLALLRLVLLYGIGCGLLLVGGLLLRASREAGWWCAGTPQATGLPRAGVNVDPASPQGAARRARLDALRDAGFGWARLRLDWGELEPQPGVYAWDAADAWIGDIAAADLVPLVVLDGSPAWARAAQDRAPHDNPFAPPADPAALARFAGSFARRYGESVRFYQVWDEPNIAPHWGNRWVEPVAYAALLKAVAPAIRAADPDAVIAAAALAPTADRGHTAMDEVYFLQRMVAAGAAGAFDAVAIQPYGFGHAPTHFRQAREVLNFQRAAFIRRELVAMGLGDKALWAVRYGWNRAPHAVWRAVTPENQAAYAVAALALAEDRWPWLEALGWALEAPALAGADDAAHEDAHEDARWGFALWEADGTEAGVLKALRQWLKNGEAQLPARAPAASCGGELPCTPAQLGALWLALLGGAALAAWRTAAAARLLPWTGWLAGWRRLPTYVQAAGWAGLLLLYYYATWPPLIGLCWLLWALLCLAQPRVGLGAAVALLPFYFQHKELHLVDAVLTVPPAAAAVACLLPAVLLRIRWAGNNRRGLGLVDAVVLAFAGISLLAAANVWQWQAYGQGLFDLVLVPLAFWFAVRASRKRGGFLEVGGLPGSGLALALFAGGVAVALWGLAAWLGGHGVAVDGVRRLVGPHFSPNHTALYLLRTLFLGVGLALLARQARHARRGNGSNPERGSPVWPQAPEAGLWAACGVVLLALVLTGSRGALLLGLPAGALALAWAALQRQPELPRRLAAHPLASWFVLAALLLGGAALLLLWDRLLNQQTLSLRLDLWEASLRLWRDHLLLGVGPGGFFWTYPAYLPPAVGVEPNQLHPHNIWLEVAATWGLLGFGWLGLLLWHGFGAVQRAGPAVGPPHAAPWLSIGLAAALLAAAAHAQVDAFFLLPDLAAWNAVALALLVSRSSDSASSYSAG